MKRALILTAAIAATSLSSQAFAQGGPMSGRNGGWGPSGQYCRMYKANTSEMVTGEIVKVDHITPLSGMSTGVHLILKTDKESLSVHLGPEWYISNQEMTLESKDKIEVRGSRILFNGEPAFIASEVIKGDQVLKLRDGSGVPAWSGWRRRQ